MNRKDEHVSLAKAFHKPRLNDFDAVQIIHQSFPEIDSAHSHFGNGTLGRFFRYPFFINAMTGGSEKAKNQPRLG